MYLIYLPKYMRCLVAVIRPFIFRNLKYYDCKIYDRHCHRCISNIWRNCTVVSQYFMYIPNSGTITNYSTMQIGQVFIIENLTASYYHMFKL